MPTPNPDLNQLIEENKALRAKLADVERSRVWQVAQRYRAWRDRILARLRLLRHSIPAAPQASPTTADVAAVPSLHKSVRPQIVFIMDVVPRPLHWGGQRRTFGLMQMAQALGWQVYVWLQKPSLSSAQEKAHLASLGFVVLPPKMRALTALLRSGELSACLITKWDLQEELAPLLQKQHVPMIIDVKDLEFIRDLRYLALNPQNRLPQVYAARYQREWSMYLKAHTLLCVSAHERDFLQSNLPKHIQCYHIADTAPFPSQIVSLEQRRGIVFVGNYHYAPNLDAITYLVEVVLPCVPLEVRAQHPLTIIGEGLPLELTSKWATVPYVQILGWVQDASVSVGQAFASLAPIRYGTGVKNKVIGAFAAGTPVITTSIGAEGLPPALMCIADTPQALAQALVSLTQDAAQWQRLSTAGLAYATQEHHPDVILARFRQALAPLSLPHAHT